MSFINTLEKLNIDEEAVDLRCNEVLPDDEGYLRGESANFVGSESHKLHYRILKTTNRLVYKDIICKPYRHWTPLGMISFRRHDIAPIPAQKKVKTWWPAQSIDDVNDNTQSIDDVIFNNQSIDDVNFNTGHEWLCRLRKQIIEE